MRTSTTSDPTPLGRSDELPTRMIYDSFSTLGSLLIVTFGEYVLDFVGPEMSLGLSK